MKRTLLLPLLPIAFAFPVIACCASAPPPLKGTIPPGTPPPEYEAPRAYVPTAQPTAQPAAPAPAAPTAAPSAAPAAPASP